ncbi:MAG: TonB-dependent receptor [Candidatus Eremiobacteraeota bacterium]|nr:TonB-dependent receptor [Candidatus Eremiobacteraeota bacterium]
MKRFSFRRPFIALVLVAMFLCQVTWALAGTTGGLSGQVTDETGAPVAGAAVKAVSASQTASVTTDSSGHFNFLALAPDTYTVSAQKDGFSPIAEPGITVFADNNQTISIRLAKALRTIAKVSATSAGSLVKGGVGQDVYNVTSSTITATNALGGGGNLNSAYSAISSVPGVQVPSGGAGWSQNVYIRGSQAFFSGFEYDGIPVNRAFDNYNASTESNLGLQELQVYTGGGPASNSSSGTAGFVNQVFKTGTYPGYLSLSGGIGTPAFYHQLKVEAGGATPDRRFSYYVGLSGYDQDFRMINSQNGANYMQPGGIYAGYSPIFDYGSSVVPTSDLALAPQVDCQTDSYGAPLLTATGSFIPVNNTNPLAPNACLLQRSGLLGNYSSISDRESVANFHFAIPLKNGLRDDLQLLTSASSLKTFTYGSANDLGTQYDPNVGMTVGAALLGDLTNNPGGAGANYVDANVYNAPFGTPVAGLTAQPYYQPSSPTNRAANSQIPLNQEDNYWNDTNIVKLQYTHQFSSNAFARLFGYTFFSDWTQAGAIDAAGYYSGYSTGPSPNYDLITHTAGGELQLVDQINPQHLLELTGNYATATVARFNNTGFLGGSSPVGDISQGSNGAYTCYSPGGNSYDPATGAYDLANPAAGSQIPCYQASSFNTNSVHPYGCAGGASCNPYTTPQSANGTYATLWNGNASGTFNTVGPRFSFVALTDQWRPNDKWLLNLGLRYENYTYELANSNTPADNFYAQVVANYSCWAPGVGVATKVLPPGVPPPAPVQYVNGDCNQGLVADGVTIPNGVTYVHPNGQAQDGVTNVPNFTAVSPNSMSQNFFSPRFSATYTESPDTVWRVSAGRYTEPPITASLQYLYASGAASTTWANFENLGFFSPYHDIPSQSSAQGDISLERHIRGTDMSFKITPFYNRTNGFQGDAFIGQGFVTQVPLGTFRSYGVEFGMTKGDFNRNGLSGSLSLTYTKSQVQYQSEFGGDLPNQIDVVNNYISQYNALANGSPCYSPATIVKNANGSSTVVPGSGLSDCSSPTAIINPYYGKPSLQGGLDPNGWYTPPTYAFQPGVYTQPGYFDSPFVGSLILNYRRNKLAVTPSVQYTEGTSYGTPFDVQGLDPRDCMANSANSANAVGLLAAGANPQQCDYTQLANLSATSLGYMYVPNPQTGSFASLGQYREPGLLTGNLQISYDISPRVNATLTLANVFHTCFGGTKAPWTTAYPAGSDVCGYNVNGYYFGNFQNGSGQLNPGNTGAYSAAANGGVTPYPWEFQSYSPSTGSPAANGTAGAQLPQPFNVFLNLSVKM